MMKNLLKNYVALSVILGLSSIALSAQEYSFNTDLQGVTAGANCSIAYLANEGGASGILEVTPTDANVRVDIPTTNTLDKVRLVVKNTSNAIQVRFRENGMSGGPWSNGAISSGDTGYMTYDFNVLNQLPGWNGASQHLQIREMGNNISGAIYIDRVVFYTGTLSTDKFDADNNNVNLYPNPVENELNIKASYGIESVKIYDVIGKLVSNSTDVSRLRSGTYIATVTQSNGFVATKRFIKK